MEFKEELLQATHLLLQANIEKILWICHSEAEVKQANILNSMEKRAIDVVYPKTVRDVSAAYSTCRMAMVTKAHTGMFCLANHVPFAIFSYDMKCDALMEMIWDFPHHLVCHIDQLANVDKKQIVVGLFDSFRVDVVLSG
ncbi:hypothetical protein KAR48_12045 [bacterium]|nr:hypothetical protein [bacterium]